MCAFTGAVANLSVKTVARWRGRTVILPFTSRTNTDWCATISESCVIIEHSHTGFLIQYTDVLLLRLFSHISIRQFDLGITTFIVGRTSHYKSFICKTTKLYFSTVPCIGGFSSHFYTHKLYSQEDERKSRKGRAGERIRKGKGKSHASQEGLLPSLLSTGFAIWRFKDRLLSRRPPRQSHHILTSYNV